MVTVLRPMSTGELLDRTFFLYRKHFVLFVGIVAVPYLLLLAFRLGSIGLATTGSVGGSVIAIALGAVVYLVALAAAQAATVVAVSDVHLDRPASISSAYGAIKGRLLKIIFIMIGVWLGTAAGFLLLIVPGIILALAWSLAIPVAVIENQGLRGATSRSSTLTKGNRGRIFVVGFLFSVLLYIAAIITQAPVFAVVGLSHAADPKAIPAWLNVLSVVGDFVSQSLVGPLFTIALALIYYDERVRKEGFDLQFMMASLQPPQQNASAAPAS